VSIAPGNDVNDIIASFSEGNISNSSFIFNDKLTKKLAGYDIN
jgi:hypothetical protein